jgi:endonuclease/exonuclease/phosphatase family metal-dependent hydrolase
LAFSLKKITKRFFIITNVVAVVLFGLPGLIPYADPRRWWWLNLLGLIFPYLFFVVLFFFLFWLVVKPKYSVFSLLILLICWKQVAVVFRLNTQDFNYKRNDTVLRVLSWNVRVFEGLQKGDTASVKGGIANFIKTSEADVVCLQEFSQYDSNGVKKNHLQAVQEAGYPYYVFLKDYEKASVDYRSGVAIFSKTPLFNGQRIAFTSSPESIAYADVAKGADTFRIFTTHLQSFRFSKADYRNMEWIKRRGDITNPANRNILAKMKAAIQIRGLQAQQIRPLLDTCPYPEIVCGDFNDVPNSYAYWHIRDDRRDAFIEKGNGVSRTFVSLAPMLRIDYILCDNRFKVEQFTTADNPYSDHLPIIADVRFERKSK